MSVAILAVLATVLTVALSAGVRSQRVITVTPPAAGITTAPVASDPADDISNGKVIHIVGFDGGALWVRPAPATAHPQIDQAQAKVVVGSDSQAYGSGWNGSVGFAEVSISASLTAGVTNTPAWVAIIKLPYSFCPYMTIPTKPVANQPRLSYPPGYLAVIVQARTKVLDYFSRSQQCDFPASGPRVAPATQIVSIPWQLVSLHGHIVTVRYQDPACDPDHGLYSVDLGGDTKTEQAHFGLFIQAPFTLSYGDLLACEGPWITQTYNYAVGLGPGAPPALVPITVTHDPSGPVGTAP